MTGCCGCVATGDGAAAPPRNDKSRVLAAKELQLAIQRSRMSPMGQNRKSSMGGYVFRFAPENGHCSMQLNRIIPLGNATFRVVGVQNWVQSNPPRLSSAGCPSDAVRCSK